MMYRVKQFIWYFSSYFKKIDMKYVEEYLDEDEKVIFNRLTHTEKDHCIRVSKDAIKLAQDKNLDLYRVGKLALLHDIGKYIYGLNIIERSIMVMLSKIFKDKIKKYNNIKAIDVYYNHAEIGADLLKKTNKYDDEFLEAIRYHHSKSKSINNELLNIIKISDDNN